MATVVVCAHNVANFPGGGGHFWAYMQYVLGLRQCGCEVYWLERLTRGDAARQSVELEAFATRMRTFGMSDRMILLSEPHREAGSGRTPVIGMSSEEAEAVMRGADLLLNFHYAMSAEMLARFRQTALVDIDPGLLQLWISRGEIDVARHDRYFTVGERLAPPGHEPPGPPLPWISIRPAVCVDRWPLRIDPWDSPMTTVSTWDGGQWIVDGNDGYENSERMSFLLFKELPQLVSQPLELAL